MRAWIGHTVFVALIGAATAGLMANDNGAPIAPTANTVIANTDKGPTAPAYKAKATGHSIAVELPACVEEDSLGCYWDAKTRGNGKGVSFSVTAEGVYTYHK